MARFRPEPPPAPEHSNRTGVLLVNLGTPEAPTAKALRPWLRQFLSDPRAVELPRLIWQPILNGLILTTRPAKSAKKYESIWTPEGSPLRVHTERLAALLDDSLNQAVSPSPAPSEHPLPQAGEGNEGRNHSKDNIVVAWAMRYGSPSIIDTLTDLRARGICRILTVPLYPQFAGSTTASALDEVALAMRSWRNLPELRFVRSFPDDPGYIAALAASVREHWACHGQGDCLVASFHGQPVRTDELGDPYRTECFVTASLLKETLALPPEALRVTFQSRFGRSKWLEPYTLPTLESLAASGVKRADVICPGFAADCLETLEEIAMLCRNAFFAHGGEEFHAIPCLNTRPEWVAALDGLVRRHLVGWV
ncbi:MAG: ferrochelatase [Betaproteobacteria bacterium]|nr:ferrochelatase [Betaproteobacteria bacterium]